MYELYYNTPDGYEECDYFTGTWHELQALIKTMRAQGYTHINAVSLDQD